VGNGDIAPPKHNLGTIVHSRRRNSVNKASPASPIIYKMWELDVSLTLWASIACYRNRFTLPFTRCLIKQLAPFFFLNFCCGTLGTAATTGLLYQPRKIGEGDCGEIGGIKIGKGNRSTRRKPAPGPFCPPQIPHD
jgi:hypothetical protein